MPNRNDYISDSVRKLVTQRAENRCEYCLIHEDDTYIGCEIDHIISIKHNGSNQDSNLAFACLPCNRFKGSDIASLTDLGELTPFFNPRKDIWSEHFQWSDDDLEMIGISPIGRATVHLLKVNRIGNINLRRLLKMVRLHPPT